MLSCGISYLTWCLGSFWLATYTVNAFLQQSWQVKISLISGFLLSLLAKELNLFFKGNSLSIQTIICLAGKSKWDLTKCCKKYEIFFIKSSFSFFCIKIILWGMFLIRNTLPGFIESAGGQLKWFNGYFSIGWGARSGYCAIYAASASASFFALSAYFGASLAYSSWTYSISLCGYLSGG